MQIKYRHNGGGEPSPEQTEKRPPVLVHPSNRPSIILIEALSIILITLTRHPSSRMRTQLNATATRNDTLRRVMMLYFDFVIEFHYPKGTESRIGSAIQPPVNDPAV